MRIVIPLLGLAMAGALIEVALPANRTEARLTWTKETLAAKLAEIGYKCTWVSPRHESDGSSVAALKPQTQNAARKLYQPPRRDPNLPPDARTTSGRKGFYHAGPVSSVAFTPDGKRIASATDGDKGAVHLWDAASGKELYAIELDGPVFTLAVSPVGNLLAAAGKDKSIRTWQADNGKGLMTLRGHEEAIYSLVFSADGKTLYSADFDGSVRVWHTASGKTVNT